MPYMRICIVLFVKDRDGCPIVSMLRNDVGSMHSKLLAYVKVQSKKHDAL